MSNFLNPRARQTQISSKVTSVEEGMWLFRSIFFFFNSCSFDITYSDCGFGDGRRKTNYSVVINHGSSVKWRKQWIRGSGDKQDRQEEAKQARQGRKVSQHSIVCSLRLLRLRIFRETRHEEEEEINAGKRWKKRKTRQARRGTEVSIVLAFLYSVT